MATRVGRPCGASRRALRVHAAGGKAGVGASEAANRVASASESPWSVGTYYGKKYSSPGKDPNTEVAGGVAWTAELGLTVAIECVAGEQGLEVADVERRFLRLTQLLQIDEFETAGVKLADIVRLATRAPADIVTRSMELKGLLPNTDVSRLAARCPALFVEGTTIEAIRSEIDAARACVEGVPAELLERLLAEEPTLFLMGNPAWDNSWETANGRQGAAGGKLVGACCKEARRIMGAKDDTAAVEMMLRRKGLVYEIAPLQNVEAA